MDAKELVSEELRQRVEDLAREQHRDPSEVLKDAVNRYAADCRLDRLQRKFGAR
jgi:predicted transcriptional regulator